MTAAQLETLLRASLELWRVDVALQPSAPLGEARARAAPGPLRARLSLPDGTSLVVAEAAPHEEPFCWWLLWHASGAPVDAPASRRKPCASTLGLLRSLREALGVSASARIRIGIGAGARPTLGGGPGWSTDAKP